MSLEFQEIRHGYGQNNILASISLAAHPGEILCLLGNSGSGKTTLLRLAAGLEELQNGRILLDGDYLAEPGACLPPESRPVGLMFQDQVLFPHMTVAENIAFGLKKLGSAKRETVIEQRIAAVGLQGFEKRYPHTLSGGEQQRVALARALAPNPKVLLMDEPFASIDVTLRQALREQTRYLVRSEGVTTILVTHDPQEAMELADRIAILANGNIVQCGTPQEIYQKPARAAVARLFGEAQSLAGTVRKNRIETAFGSFHWDGEAEDAAVDIILRPNAVTLHPCEGEARHHVIDVRFRGDAQLAYILPIDGNHGQKPLRVRLQPGQTFETGAKVDVRFDPAAVFVFPG